MGFGLKLRQLGKLYFGTLKRFAEAWEVHESTLQKYINEEQEPGRTKLAKLIPLGFDLNYLLDDTAALNGQTFLKEKKYGYETDILTSIHGLCNEMERVYSLIITQSNFENVVKENYDLVLLLRFMERTCEVSMRALNKSVEDGNNSFIKIDDKKMLQDVIAKHKKLLTELKRTNSEIELSSNYEMGASGSAV